MVTLDTLFSAMLFLSLFMESTGIMPSLLTFNFQLLTPSLRSLSFLGVLGDLYGSSLVTGDWQLVTQIAFSAPRSRVPAVQCTNCTAAAMSEPVAAHSGISRASCRYQCQ
jgi:hypothetical protein